MADEGLSKYVDFRSLPDPEDRFHLHSLIATGTYGEIYEATDAQNDDQMVAIKIIENIKENLEEIEEEHRVLSELSQHENFPQFFGTFLKRSANLEDHQLWFVMELMTQGSVSELARAYKLRDERMPEKLIAYILKEIIKAVQHLHQAHVMHRDVKGMNVLITEDGRIKLVDFGQCGHLDSTRGRRNTAMGTPYWMAPEVIECEQKADHDYDNRCDVWALGITAIELADGEPPYSDIHPVRALFLIVTNPPPTLKIVSHWSQDFADFISECLVKTPDHRPILLEVQEHPFITAVPEDPTELRNLLLEERQRLIDSDYVPKRPITSIVRQGYLKTERLSKPTKMITDDLASLDVFNDEVVLDTLFCRWKDGKVYTWVADVLVAVNPFADTCKYDEEVQVKYKSKSRSHNDPHVFAVADRAHQDMMHHKEHQTIVLTGESGSGKTYNFHQLINQFTYISYSNPSLMDKLKRVCSVLDAFGNAVTQLNPNSTRHLRYFDITFSKTGKISGAIVWLLMLDKFRVTEQPRDEGNFHVFYYTYDGLSQTERLSRYGLKVGRKYRYLGKHPYDNEVTNAQKFAKIEEDLQVIGFRDREMHTILLVLSAILTLGNVEFSGDQKAVIVDEEPVREVCRLLDIEEKKLSWALCNYCRAQTEQKLESAKKTQEEAELSRDALARTLYTRLVDFVVNSINSKLSVTRFVFGDPYAIGILDMFGFEANDHNTLENLLVNVANEQVQYYYNQYVFNWEMQDYKEEGISVKNFTFPDNRHILELFLAKNCGIFAILEDESRQSCGSDASLSYKLKQRVNQKQLQQVSEYKFAISHYVGRVKYDIHGFVKKNRDHISAELIQTMRMSGNDYIRSMFCNKLTKTGNVTVEREEHTKVRDKAGTPVTSKKDHRRFNTKSKGRMSQSQHMHTLAMNFRYSLIELLYKLTNSQPHFLRCIRSNMDNSGSIFDRDMIKHQIKYHAICDTIRIRQQGFSYRIPYQEFLRRYQFLAFEFHEPVDVTKDNARLLLLRLRMEGWAIGKDKVFLKYYNEEFLSRLYESSVKKIIKIQAVMRSYMLRKNKNKSEITKPQDNSKGVKVHEKNLEIINRIKERQRFGEDTIEAEAARYVQFYFRKWKMRTLFQQLQVYRADKQQKLVYFSQQVHLYGQETQARQQRINHLLDLDSVCTEAPGAHKILLTRVKVAQPKLALDHTLNAYFDTTFLCDPSRARKGRQQDDDWEAPFKTRDSSLSVTDADEEGKCSVTATDVSSKAAIFEQGLKTSESKKTPTTPTTTSSYNRFAGSNSYRPPPNFSNFTKPIQVNQYSSSYIKTPASRPSVVVNTWNERQHNGYTNTVDQDDQGLHDFRKMLRKTNRSVILELEARVAAAGGATDGIINFKEKKQEVTGGDDDQASPDDEASQEYPEISPLEEMLERIKEVVPEAKEDVTQDTQATKDTQETAGKEEKPETFYPNGDDRSSTPTFTEETEEAML
ncbi:hypothetical protein OTU49_009338 [Cherax quadricarinatus]|uniref:Neither inactivation nor afterpotential protein C n=1 Tax=Cherax quadricarinatus TaxID=27406 RepID=A0AAW0WKQ2_CHEQU